jgi:hypothetical protein
VPLRDPELDAFQQTLTPRELEYAQQFALFISEGAPRPVDPYEIPTARQAEIRSQLSRAWARNVWRRR